MPFSSGVYTLPTNSFAQPVTGTVISSTSAISTWADFVTAFSTCVLKDGTQVLTANIPMGTFKLTGLGAGTAAGNSVRWEQTLAGLSAAAGDIEVATGANAIAKLAIGTKGQSLIADSAQFTTNVAGWGYPAMRGHLCGLTMSTAGASTTMTIAAGQATDSTNTVVMSLASALAKTTSAWAVGTGNGGLDTSSIATSTWYHFYEIMRPDTGVVDVIFSLSASSPALPTNYTLYRRIGSGKTNGSSQWILFFQDGDYFEWDAVVADISASNPGTSAVTRTLTVPLGVRVLAILSAGVASSTTGATHYGLLSDLSITDAAAGTGNAQFDCVVEVGGAQVGFGTPQIWTNTSAQIRSRLSASNANTTLYVNTRGWIDRRGRDS